MQNLLTHWPEHDLYLINITQGNLDYSVTSFQVEGQRQPVTSSVRRSMGQTVELLIRTS